jgi:hypothetical protein
MLFRIRADCDTRGQASVADLNRAVAALPPHVDISSFQMFLYVIQASDEGRCKGITPIQLADALARAADKATRQADDAWPKARLRQLAARRYADAGLWSQALTQARLSWHKTTHPAYALLLVEALVHQGQIEEARRIYAEAAARTDFGDPGAAEGLRKLQLILDQPAAGPRSR